MADLLKKNITYKGLADSKLTVILTDSEDNRWTIWKKGYQSEEDSEAYAGLQHYKFGERFGISYAESPESFVNKEGKTINFTKRTIYSILPPLSETATQKPQPTTTAQTVETIGRDYDKENVGKCQSLFLQAYIQSGHSFSEALLQAGQAKKLAEVVVYGQTSGEELPVIQQQEDTSFGDTEIDNYQAGNEINMEDIPF